MTSRVRLSEEEPTILSLEDDVLECFFVDGSKRIHLSHIKGISLTTEHSGKHLLTIDLKRDSLLLWVDGEHEGQVRELVETVKKAMSDAFV